MREFLPNDQIDFLIGDEVSFVAFHPNHLHIQVVNGPFLVSEREVRFTPFNGKTQVLELPVRKQQTTLCDLIGKTVSDIDVRDCLLALRFKGGDTLEVVSIIGPYESGHINKDGEYFVF
jgi:hypothetical protein